MFGFSVAAYRAVSMDIDTFYFELTCTSLVKLEGNIGLKEYRYDIAPPALVRRILRVIALSDIEKVFVV